MEYTGVTFNSTKTNAREALEEHKFLKSVNVLTAKHDKISMFLACALLCVLKSLL